MIKEYGFLKDRGQLTYQEYRDVAISLQFKEIAEFEKVIQFGDDPEDFYMLFNGIVSVQVPNQAIKKWDLSWKEYQRVRKWKIQELDPRIEQAKADKMDNYEGEVVRKQTT